MKKILYKILLDDVLKISFLISKGWNFTTNNKLVKDNITSNSIEDAIRYQNTEDNFHKRWNTDYANEKFLQSYSKLNSEIKGKHLKEYHLWNLELEELKKKKDSE